MDRQKRFHISRSDPFQCRRGISALELLVVMAFIAILAGFIYPTYTSARVNVKVARTKMAMVQVATALEMYHNDYHIYPGELADLDLIGIDLTELPKDGFNDDEDFQYFVNKYSYKGSTYTPGQLYLLGSNGPDRDLDCYGTSILSPTVPVPFPDTDEYDSTESVYDSFAFIEMNAGSRNPGVDSPRNAENQSNYEDGDLFLWGPVQMSQLKEYETAPGSGNFYSTGW